jgi:ATP-dependent helicase HrpA/adenine-specific DNA-methyltransferase
VDGGQHFAEVGKESDRNRDAYLDSLGLRVKRYNNHEVLTNIEGVVSDLIQSMMLD